MIDIKKQMLSNYQLKIANFYVIPFGSVKKLVSNFFVKEKSVLHYENLQLYLRLGLKPKKKHGLLEFNQSHWVKAYIDFNSQMKEQKQKKMVTKIEKRCAN